MTNKEFYFDRLLAVALENACGTFHRVVHGKNCGGKSCEDCEFSTVESIENWLNKEHVESEPPLLENGDGLKPGDWIMVRDVDSQSFVRRQFLYFLTENLSVPPQTTHRLKALQRRGCKPDCWRNETWKSDKNSPSTNCI